MEQNIERRQLLSLGVVLFLAPALRLFPAEAASAAGRASWLTPLAALPPLLFYAAFLVKLLSLRREGEALPELLGRAAGKPALALTALWLLLYAAFVLRAGADRFVGTVYPRASYAVFAEVMGALALAGALAGFSYLFYYRANHRLGCARGMATNATYIIWGVALNVCFSGAALQPFELLGCGLVFAGVLLTAFCQAEA